jgi:predicted transcriptional regulator
MTKPPRMAAEDCAEFLIRLRKDEIEALKQIAKQEGRSLKMMARRAVQDAICKHRQKNDDGERGGLDRFLENAERVMTVETK